MFPEPFPEAASVGPVVEAKRGDNLLVDRNRRGTMTATYSTAARSCIHGAFESFPERGTTNVPKQGNAI